VELLMAVKQRAARVIGDEQNFHPGFRPDHHDVLENA
jgi:hypothetical protein